MPVNLLLETFFPCRARIPQFEDVMFSGVLDEPDSESAICSSLVNRGVPPHLPSLPTQRDDPNKVLAGSNPALAFYDTLEPDRIAR
jgi:hypothetical protein